MIQKRVGIQRFTSVIKQTGCNSFQVTVQRTVDLKEHYKAESSCAEIKEAMDCLKLLSVETEAQPGRTYIPLNYTSR